MNTTTERESWSINEEDFTYDSLQELLGCNDCEVGQVVYFGEAVPITPSQLFDADDLVDAIMNRAYDLVGEHADDYPSFADADAAKAEIDQFIEAWITKHCPPTFWQVPNSQPYTITAEDLAP